MNLAINLAMPLTISKSKLKHFRRIEELDLELEEQQLELFWNGFRAKTKKNTMQKPVHRQEISSLKEKFRIILDSFQLIMTRNHCRHYDFRVRKVVKSQYGATTKKGEEMRALIFYSSIW
jgi:hypothetical protein